MLDLSIIKTIKDLSKDNYLLVMITGKARAGKTSLANLLKSNIECVEITSFAKVLKDIAKMYFGVVKDSNNIVLTKEFINRSVKRLVEDYPEFANVPDAIWNTLEDCHDGREFLQVFGTDVTREYLGSNYWINKTKKYIEDELFDFRIVIIDDLRFINESKLELNGRKKVIIKKFNPYLLDNISKHRSETELAYIDANYIVGDIFGPEYIPN